jgi:hypothetical protein
MFKSIPTKQTFVSSACMSFQPMAAEQKGWLEDNAITQFLREQLIPTHHLTDCGATSLGRAR